MRNGLDGLNGSNGLEIIDTNKNLENMATYSEIWGELEELRAKWKTMTDEEKASAGGVAMEKRAKELKERLTAMEAAVESYCNDKFRNQL